MSHAAIMTGWVLEEKGGLLRGYGPPGVHPWLLSLAAVFCQKAPAKGHRELLTTESHGRAFTDLSLANTDRAF